jgi:uncharacterized membrane protein
MESIIVTLLLVVIGVPVVALLLCLGMRNKMKRMQAHLDKLDDSIELLAAEVNRISRHAATGSTAPARSSASDASPTPQPGPATAPPPVATETDAVQTPAPIYAAAQISQAETRAPRTEVTTPADAVEPDRENTAGTRAKNPLDHVEDLIRRSAGFVTSYFTDGNLFVRIGILVLFCGVAFLLKYAAENSQLPIEFRFMGAALGGIGLLGFGWRLRHSRSIYGLLLQGAGVGIVYITIFAAFRLADLLPPMLTFALLVLFSATAVALAILQNSKALAVYAVLGGFLAPLLASTGSGNYIGLFSYYAVLNAAVLAIAWYRAWRALNLVGFVFTFGVFALWVASGFKTADWQIASAFLVLFLLMYSLIGVLYALRQPLNMTGLVDGTLVFGTPVVVSSLLMIMLRHFDYGIAVASAGMGLYYMLLARFTWKSIGTDFRLLAEAMLAIGVVFATVAIPYALDGHWSTAAWALEAAGILWVSIRQQRFYAQCFAVALQFGAGALFLLGNVDDIGTRAWFNPAFLGGVFIALGAFVSARMLYLQDTDFKLRRLHWPFFIWGMGWWLVSAMVQIDAYLVHQLAACLVLLGLTAALLLYLDRLLGWHWQPASVSAALLLPCLMVVALVSLIDNGHLLVKPDLYAWVAVLGLSYWIICKLESVAWPGWVMTASHTGLVTLATLVFSIELLWLADARMGLTGTAYDALFCLLPLIVIRIAQRQDLPAIKRLGAPLQVAIIATLSVILLIWGLMLNLDNSGDPAPLPYLPFANPVDLSQIAFIVLALASLKLLAPAASVRRGHLLAVIAGYSFIWITAVLTRSMHHYLDIPFDLSTLYLDTRVQTAISILWTLIGMAAMWLASRHLGRQAWIAGAVLVGVVLVKMFFVDLGASGTVERIVSFLVVGSLLVATGYFSPIPARDRDSGQTPGVASHA